MTYTRRQIAIKTAKLRSKSHVPTSDAGHCLREVRECLAIPLKYPTAFEAWHHADKQHRAPVQGGDALAEFLKDIPRGVPVFWGKDEGHVALWTGYGNNIWSTDILRTGYFDKVNYSLIHTKWRKPFLGWTEDLNGVPVYP